MDEVLKYYDNIETCFAEHEVNQAVRNLRDKGSTAPPEEDWLAELIAFEFMEGFNWDDWKDDGWGTYFGPSFVLPNEDGTANIIPHISKVSSNMLKYWETRAKEAKHPILKARYSGLVWDLSNTVIQQKPLVDMACIRIDSIIEIAKRNCHKYESDTFDKLSHALNLALSINDNERTLMVRDAILNYEKLVAKDDKLGLWGYAYDLLLKNKKVTLTEVQRDKIITDLEERLARVSDISNNNTFEPWASEAAAIRLADYYKAENKHDDVKRVLIAYIATFEKMAEGKAALLVTAWFQQIHRVLIKYGLKEKASQILLKIRALGQDVHDGLTPITTTTEISIEEMNGYVSSIIGDDLVSALRKIAIHYVPTQADTENQLRELAKSAPVTFLFSRSLLDHKGRTVAIIGPLKNDLEGHIIMQISQNIQISAIFLREVMNNLRSKYNLKHEIIVDYLFKSPIFDENKKQIFAKGFKAYFDGDALTAIHLLTPQIEDTVRNLIEYAGGLILSRNRHEGWNLKTLNDLLKHDLFKEVFNEDIALYFRILFTDQRGINLRNNLCHGISLPETFNLDLADRVIHALLLLAQVREKDEKE